MEELLQENQILREENKKLKYRMNAVVTTNE